MKAMVLAAGEGRRMRPLTESLPKPMLPVAGRPLLARIVAHLRRYGVREIGVNLHHRAETIAAFLERERRTGLRASYVWEERLMGSAGGVKRLEWFFQDGTFFVLYGDVLTDIDLDDLHQYHVARGAAITMALYQPEELSACGVARLDATLRVIEFVEKPAPHRAPSSWANAGVYVVEPSVLDHIPPDEPCDFGADVLPLLLARGVPVFGYRSDARVIDIGTPEGYRRAQEAMERAVSARAA